MLVIAAVAIIVVGPKDLPGMLRSLGKTIGGVKRMAGDFQRQFNDAIREADLDEVKDLTSTKGFGPLEDARKSMEEFAQTIQDPVSSEPEIEAPAEKKEAEPVKKPAVKKATAKKPAAQAQSAKTKAAPKKPAAKKAAPRKTTARKTAPKKPAAGAKSTT